MIKLIITLLEGLKNIFLFNTLFQTKSGTYIANEMGVRQILTSLSAARNKIAPDAKEVYDDVVETLRFLNTVESTETVSIPRLNIPDLTRFVSLFNTKCQSNL